MLRRFHVIGPGWRDFRCARLFSSISPRKSLAFRPDGNVLALLQRQFHEVLARHALSHQASRQPLFSVFRIGAGHTIDDLLVAILIWSVKTFFKHCAMPRGLPKSAKLFFLAHEAPNEHESLAAILLLGTDTPSNNNDSAPFWTSLWQQRQNAAIQSRQPSFPVYRKS